MSKVTPSKPNERTDTHFHMSSPWLIEASSLHSSPPTASRDLSMAKQVPQLRNQLRAMEEALQISFPTHLSVIRSIHEYVEKILVDDEKQLVLISTCTKYKSTNRSETYWMDEWDEWCLKYLGNEASKYTQAHESRPKHRDVVSVRYDAVTSPALAAHGTIGNSNLHRQGQHVPARASKNLRRDTAQHTSYDPPYVAAKAIEWWARETSSLPVASAASSSGSPSSRAMASSSNQHLQASHAVLDEHRSRESLRCYRSGRRRMLLSVLCRERQSLIRGLNEIETTFELNGATLRQRPDWIPRLETDDNETDGSKDALQMSPRAHASTLRAITEKHPHKRAPSYFRSYSNARYLLRKKQIRAAGGMDTCDSLHAYVPYSREPFHTTLPSMSPVFGEVQDTRNEHVNIMMGSIVISGDEWQAFRQRPGNIEGLAAEGVPAKSNGSIRTFPWDAAYCLELGDQSSEEEYSDEECNTFFSSTQFTTGPSQLSGKVEMRRAAPSPPAVPDCRISGAQGTTLTTLSEPRYAYENFIFDYSNELQPKIASTPIHERTDSRDEVDETARLLRFRDILQKELKFWAHAEHTLTTHIRGIKVESSRLKHFLGTLAHLPTAQKTYLQQVSGNSFEIISRAFPLPEYARDRVVTGPASEALFMGPPAEGLQIQLQCPPRTGYLIGPQIPSANPTALDIGGRKARRPKASSKSMESSSATTERNQHLQDKSVGDVPRFSGPSPSPFSPQARWTRTHQTPSKEGLSQPLRQKYSRKTPSTYQRTNNASPPSPTFAFGAHKDQANNPVLSSAALPRQPSTSQSARKTTPASRGEHTQADFDDGNSRSKPLAFDTHAGNGTEGPSGQRARHTVALQHKNKGHTEEREVRSGEKVRDAGKGTKVMDLASGGGAKLAIKRKASPIQDALPRSPKKAEAGKNTGKAGKSLVGRSKKGCKVSEKRLPMRHDEERES